MEYIVSYRIVLREKPSYRIDIVSNRKKAYRYWLVGGPEDVDVKDY